MSRKEKVLNILDWFLLILTIAVAVIYTKVNKSDIFLWLSIVLGIAWLVVSFYQIRVIYKKYGSEYKVKNKREN